jgi:putative cell wall-binding protein
MIVRISLILIIITCLISLQTVKAQSNIKNRVIILTDIEADRMIHNRWFDYFYIPM